MQQSRGFALQSLCKASYINAINYMSVLIYTSMFICTACKHVWIYVLHTFCLTCTLHTHRRRCVQMYYLSEAPGRSHALSAAPASDVIAPYVNSKKKPSGSLSTRRTLPVLRIVIRIFCTFIRLAYVVQTKHTRYCRHGTWPSSVTWHGGRTPTLLAKLS